MLKNVFNRRDFIKFFSIAAVLPKLPVLFPQEVYEIPMLLNYTSEDQVYLSCLHRANDNLIVKLADTAGHQADPDSSYRYFLPLGDYVITRYFFSKLKKLTQYNVKVSSVLNHKDFYKNFVLPDLESKKTRLAVVSCTSVRQSDRNRMWEKVYSTSPDAILFIGDAVYADSFEDSALGRPATVTTYLDNFIETWRGVSLYTREKLIPTLAVWDDHDFGWNDGSGTRPDKQIITEVFRNFYYVPADHAQITKGPGISFLWDAFGTRIIFLDDRTFRNYSQSVEVNTCWGAEQKAWLEQVLKDSPTKNIFLINGSQYRANSDKEDALNVHHKNDYNWVMNLIAQSDKKVVLLSGDVHFSSIQKINFQNKNIYEITSSCLHCVNAGEKHRTSPAEGQLTYCGEKNFVLVEVDSTTDFAITATCLSKSSNNAFKLSFAI